MPIFTASGKISWNTQSSWLAKNAGSGSTTPYTPVVFWAVSAVTTLIPYTPCMRKVFKSA